MAWVAEDNFDSYSDEANLAGTSGGSGWGGNWTNAATNLIRSDTAQNYNTGGTTSARVITSGGGNTFYTRLITAAETGSGTMYVAMRKTSASLGENAFSLRSSAGNRCGITMGTTGNILAQGTNIFTSYAADTWYVIEINYNVAANNYTARVHNGSTWGALSGTIAMGSSGNIDRVGIGGDTFTGSAWVDLITPTNPIVSTSVKDIISSGFIPFAR